MRRSVGYILWCCLVTAGTWGAAYAQKANDNGKKMNVVFFLVDDLGWSDVGINNPGSFYETPNIDQLARENVRFTNAYASCHVCSPSRASIMTGKNPARIGLTDWLPGRNNFPFQKLENVPIIQQLPFEEQTIAETFRANGYRTAMFGKWHLGEDSSSPIQHGFDERITEWNKGWPLSYYSPFKLKGLEGPDGEYLTDRLTNEAIRYIERNKDNPFFLVLSHFAVHDPIEGRSDLVKKYEKKLATLKKSNQLPFILETNPDTSHVRSREELNALLNDERFKGYDLLPDRTVKIKQLQDNIHFAAMVESMDQSLGQILLKLKALGLEENTIVIFVSDNGGMSAGNYARPNKKIPEARLDKEFATSNLPLRGAKGWFYEGGIRVPLIVKWPGHEKQGSVSDVPVIHTDFYPSLLEMTGASLLPAQHQDGVSFVRLLKGKKSLKRKALYWHFPHYSNHGLQSPGGVIRFGKYKLLEYYENGTVQLFDLEKDPGELNDISGKMTSKVKKLKKMMARWREKTGAKMMRANPNYKISTVSN